jgi:hypothetical protein
MKPTKRKAHRPLSRWFRQAPDRWLRNRHSCLNCGFLSFDGDEASTDVRRTVAAEGKAGWFRREEEDDVDCYKHLWSWESGGGPQLIIYEANRPRFHCVGFHRHVPGRSPQDHLKLEDEAREFRRRFILVLVPPLIAVIAGLVVSLKLALGAAIIALVAGLWAGLKHH